MAAIDSQGDAFLRAIDEASREQRTAMIADLDEYRQQQLRVAADIADQKYDEYIRIETSKLSSEDGVETAKRSTDLKKEVMNTRSEISEKIFNAVLLKLADFTETSDYKNFVINSAEQMAKICGTGTFDIYLREQDVKYSNPIKSVSDTITDIKVDNTIKIGGLYGICPGKKIKLNDTLESRFEEARDWFYENSGLTL